MELHELSAKNTSDIKRLLLEIFSGEPWNDVWADTQLELYVLELLGNSNPLLLGLYENGRLIGLSLGRIKHWCEGTEYWIDEFGILPEKQNQGAGTEFLTKIKRYLSERGVAGMVLLTERTVPAYHFYKRNGFYEKEEQAFLAADIS